MPWQDEIATDPTVCHGQPCFRGTRIPVHVVLDNLAAGCPPDAILRDYPSLPPGAVQAAIAYAAQIAREPVVALPE